MPRTTYPAPPLGAPWPVPCAVAAAAAAPDPPSHPRLRDAGVGQGLDQDRTGGRQHGPALESCHALSAGAQKGLRLLPGCVCVGGGRGGPKVGKERGSAWWRGAYPHMCSVPLYIRGKWLRFHRASRTMLVRYNGFGARLFSRTMLVRYNGFGARPVVIPSARNPLSRGLWFNPSRLL